MRISHSCGRSSGGGKTGSHHLPALRAAQRPEQVVEVRLLERRQPGQDHVGVAGRLVDPVVDADHAVELGQRRVEAAGVGRR